MSATGNPPSLPDDAARLREQETPAVQRYDLVTNYRCGSSIEEMERSDDGEWVRWEAVEAEITRLTARLQGVEQERQALIRLARDIGNVIDVAKRRTIFRNEHEKQENAQMLQRLQEWRATCYAVSERLSPTGSSQP